jgi:hypothetical protein
MENDFGDINDDVLLVGEANFSFTISLLPYLNGKLITTTCYESYADLEQIYGASLDENLKLLSESHVHSTRFEVDARKLGEYFKSSSFSKIIFMFPHVCKKSNLKLNRSLIKEFLLSTHSVLKPDGKIYITLAKGQGGTCYETINKASNDNWQLLRIINETGFLLTDVRPFNVDRYDYYKCTGFRKSSKGFNLDGSLVHRLQFSLAFHKNGLSSCYNRHFSSADYFELDFPCLDRYLRKSIDFYDGTLQHHPLMTLKNTFVRCLINNIGDYFNLKTDIEDGMPDFASIHLHSHPDNVDMMQSYKLDDEHLNFLNEKLHLGLRDSCFYTKQTLFDQNLLSKYCQTKTIFMLSGLLLATRDVTDNEFNNYSYNLLFFLKKQVPLQDCTLQKIISKVIRDILDSSPSFRFDKHTELFTKGNKVMLRHHTYEWKIMTIIENPENLVCEVDLGRMCLIQSNETDKRLLYSNDRRIVSDKCVKQLMVQTSTHRHDISFWHKPDSFDFYEFYDVIRDVCGSLVSKVELIDSYRELDKCSSCFRIFYESCDCALSFSQSSSLQLNLRERLAQKMHLVMR